MRRLILAAAVLALWALWAVGCGEETTTGPGVDKVEGPYAGTDACKLCHAAVHAEFVKTGHPYKLNQVDGGAPHYPYSEVPNPPPGKTWDDVTYVIGGYGWKARFIDTQGYVMTGLTQYNLQTKEWVEYEPGETVPYDCGSCHTTGFEETGHQHGLPGVEGTWVMPGIQCEACHGPGDAHVADPTYNDMTINRASSSCGLCHIRDTKYVIPAQSGFIKHHEQYNEFFNSPHGNELTCVSCHDPHKNVKYGGGGIVRNCDDCHNQQVQVNAMANLDCTACHMPPAVKSAVGDATQFKGDIAAHLFRINTDPNAEQFYTVGDDEYSYFYINLDFACLRGGCHNGRTRTWAANNAPFIHGTGTENTTLAAAVR